MQLLVNDVGLQKPFGSYLIAWRVGAYKNERPTTTRYKI